MLTKNDIWIALALIAVMATGGALAAEATATSSSGSTDRGNGPAAGRVASPAAHLPEEIAMRIRRAAHTSRFELVGATDPRQVIVELRAALGQEPGRPPSPAIPLGPGELRRGVFRGQVRGGVPFVGTSYWRIPPDAEATPMLKEEGGRLIEFPELVAGYLETSPNTGVLRVIQPVHLNRGGPVSHDLLIPDGGSVQILEIDPQGTAVVGASRDQRRFSIDLRKTPELSLLEE